MSGKDTADEVEKLTGWRPPVMYDIMNDTYRVATQEDFDQLKRLADAYRTLRVGLSSLMEDKP